jgi:hypothetical protein
LKAKEKHKITRIESGVTVPKGLFIIYTLRECQDSDGKKFFTSLGDVAEATLNLLRKKSWEIDEKVSVNCEHCVIKIKLFQI